KQCRGITRRLPRRRRACRRNCSVKKPAKIVSSAAGLALVSARFPRKRHGGVARMQATPVRIFAMRALTRRLMLTTTVVGTAAGVAAAATPLRAQSVMPSDTDWPVYGGNLGYWRYKALDQINAANFNQLEVAWQFKTD